MKIFTFLFLMLACAGFAQDKETTEFFRQHGEGCDTIYFIKEPIGESRIKEIKKKIAKGYLTGSVIPIPMTKPKGHPLTLTAKEKQFLLAELDKEISSDRKIYLSKNKNYVFIEKFDHERHNSYVHYSKPIFFRNNTLCLIYTSRTGAPESGGGGWNVYRKEKGVWKQWLMVTMWIS